MTERRYEDGDIALWGNVEPVCPHCGHDQETTDLNSEFEDFKDGDTIETQCDHCEKEFYVKLNMPVRYNTFVDEI